MRASEAIVCQVGETCVALEIVWTSAKSSTYRLSSNGSEVRKSDRGRGVQHDSPGNKQDKGYPPTFPDVSDMLIPSSRTSPVEALLSVKRSGLLTSVSSGSPFIVRPTLPKL